MVVKARRDGLSGCRPPLQLDKHAAELAGQAHDFVAGHVLALEMRRLDLFGLQDEERGLPDQGLIEVAGCFKLRLVPTDEVSEASCLGAAAVDAHEELRAIADPRPIGS